MKVENAKEETKNILRLMLPQKLSKEYSRARFEQRVYSSPHCTLCALSGSL
jgi:hypothetical protein